MLHLEDYGANEEEYEKIIKTKKTCKYICNWFLNEKGSIRMCAKNLCLSKSLVHVYIHSYIKTYYFEEYQQIMRILKYNSHYRTKPHKYWFGRPI